METIGFDWTSIIVGVLTLLGGCAWFVNWRKDKQEAKGLKADNRMKDMELAKMYVDEYDQMIVAPLRHRVQKLESQYERLQDGLQSVYDCPLSGDCPVIDRMRRQPKGEH